MAIFARFKHAMSHSFSDKLFQFCFISLFWVLGLQVQGQTVILSPPNIFYNNTDGITTDVFNVGVGNCTSISFSLNFAFSLPWIGAGNLESNDECPFGVPPCIGDPTIGVGDVGACANCWDFLYVRYQIDGVTVFSRLVGVPGDLAQTGTINFGPICTQNAANASIIINTQTWAGNESVTLSNITITCWDASATPAANPNPACASQPISLTGNLTNPSSVSSQVWTGPGTIANPNSLNTTVTNVPLGTNVYTLTTTDDNNCTETSTVSVEVNPGPTVTNPGPQTFCAGQTVPSIPLTGTATTYNWTNSNTAIGLGASGTGDIPSFTAANVGVTTTGTITVTPISPGCTGAAITFPITINPAPTVNQPANITVCGGGPNSTVTLTGSAGSILGWTNDNTATGVLASGTGSFTFSPANVAATEVSTITVTPTNATGCPGIPRTFTITVNPGPTVINPGPQVFCAGDATPVIDLMGTATTFNWTNSNTAIGLGASGTGDIPSFTAANVAATTTGTITVTPSSPGCTGAAITFPITINPAPTANQPANITVCGGGANSTVTLTGSAGSILGWTNDNTATGVLASGTGSFTFSPANVAATEVSTITVTPTNAAGCPGIPRTFTITVNPGPTVTNPGPQVFCAGDATPVIDLVGTATTFNWTNSNTAIGLGASGTGDIPSFTAANVAVTTTGTITVTPSSPGCTGAAITFLITINPAPTANQPANITVCGGGANSTVTLTGSAGSILGWTNDNTATGVLASGTGSFTFSPANVAATQVSTITVTPTNAAGCPGIPRTFTITVNPGPTVVNPGPQVFCAGDATPVIDLMGTATTFNWTNSNTAIGLGASGTGDIPSFIAANVATTTTGTITVTPSSPGCTGAVITFPITINPAPTVNQPANITVCGGGANSTVTLTGSAGSILGWTNDNTATGVLASGTGSFSFTPANVTTTQVSTITVTPTNAAGCPGISRTFTITVNPAPTVTNPGPQVFCAGASVPLINLTGTATTFNWTNSNTAIGLGASGTGDIPSFTAANVAATTTGTITVTPSSPGCTGAAITFPITINPTPTANQPANITVCGGGANSTVTLTGSAGSILGWTNNNVATGVLASGTGSFSFTPANVTTTQVSTITVTPTNAAGCPGIPRTFTITVNPLPTLSIGTVACAANLLTYSIIVSSNTPITASSGVVSSTAPNFLVDLITAGVNVTITATDATTGCNRTLSVNAPNCSCASVAPATNPNSPAICEGAPLPSLTVVAAAGLQVDWYAAASGGVALATNTLSFTPPPGAYPPGTYTFFAETREPISGCVSTTRIAVTFTVNVVPVANTVPDRDTCAGQPLAINLTGTIGATFNWTNSNTAIGLGATGNGNISFVPPVGLTAQQVATITVTPILGTCPGAPITFQLTAQPLPVLTVVNVQCAPNLLTYSVNFTGTLTDVSFITTTSGTIGGTAPNFAITQIPAGTNITITALAQSGSGCSVQSNITAPNCNCPNVAPPSTPNNPSACEGAALPNLTVTVSAGFTADWFATPTGGTAILSNSATFVIPPGVYPAGTYTFYVEAKDPATGCVSLTRTPVVLTINATPTANSVLNQTVCAGNSMPIINLTGTAGATFNWTAAPVIAGLNATGSGSVNYAPPANLAANVTSTVTVTPVLGTCPGTPLTFTITGVALPSITFGTPICAPDFLSYTVNVTTTTATITSNAGTVSGTAGNFTVSGIPISTNLTVSTTNALACTNQQSLTAPVCNCPPVATPTMPNNPSACEGAALPNLTVSVGAGLQVNWYATPVGGTAILTNTTTLVIPPGAYPAGTYTFYAESLNPFTNCVSTTRTPVVLTIRAIPVANAVVNQIACAGQTLNIAFSGSGNPSFAWTNSNTAIGIPASGNGSTLVVSMPASITTQQVATISVTPSANGCVGAPISFTVTGVPRPVMGTIPDTVICAGQVLNVNFTSTPPATVFNWTNSNAAIGLATVGNGPIALTPPLSASGQIGMITVTPALAVGTLSCLGAPVLFDISVINNPIVNDPPDQTTCIGVPLSVPFTGTSGASFTWTNSNPAIGLPASGSGPINFVPTAAGTASIVVTPEIGTSGCTGPGQTFTITVSPAITASITGDLSICAGQSTVLNAAGGPTVNWLSGQNTSVITVNPIQTRTYSAIVSNNGACKDTATVTVTVSQPYNVVINNTTCDPALVGSVVQNLTSVALCDSIVTTNTAIDLVSCKPVAAIVGDTVSCSGSADGTIRLSVTAGFAPYTYTWAGAGQTGNGQISAINTPVTLNNLGAGIYTVTITSINGATTIVNAVVVEPPPMTLNIAPVILSGGFGVTCKGIADGQINTSLTGGTGPFSYLWSDASTTVQLNNVEAGTYTLTVTDNNGCTTSNQGTLTAPQGLNLGLVTFTPRCGSLILDAILNPTGGTGPYVASVNGTAVSGLRLQLPSGDQTIQVEDANGCTEDTTLTINLLESVLVSLPMDTSIELGQLFDITAQTNLDVWKSVTWTPQPDTARDNSLRQVWQPLESASYRVDIVDTSGCTGFTVMRVNVRQGNVYIPNVFTPDSDGGNETWRIFADASVEFLENVHVFDRWGDEVYGWDDPVPVAGWSGWNGRARNKMSPPGVYVYYVWLRMRNGERVLLEGDVTILR